MPNKKIIYNISKILIATIWLINGLFCKLLGFVPRHELIVARILGPEHAIFFTKTIGIAETLMAVWIVSGIMPRLNAWAQIVIIATMNCIEFALAQDLLLWGKVNSIFALMFILFIYYNEYKLKPVKAI
jgi:hypothetical protein